MKLFKRLNPLQWLYSFLIAITLLLLLIIVALSAVWDVFTLRDEFIASADKHTAYIHDRLVKNETLLIGFGAFVAGGDRLNLDAAKSYADVMLARYPQVTMFQIARDVTRHNSQDFTQEVNGLLGERVEILDNLGQRTALESILEKKPSVFPVMFIAPRGASRAMGLDLRTIDVVSPLLPTGKQIPHSISVSDPFELFEGDQAIVMLHTVVRGDERYVVVLVAKLADILPPELLSDSRKKIAIKLRDRISEPRTLYSTLNTQNTEPGINYQLSAKNHLVFADYQVSVDFIQPVQIKDLNWLKTLIILLLTVALVVVILSVQRVHLLVDKKLADQRANLYRQANFDPLTGLANRLYFELAARKMVYKAERDHEHLVIYFIDLNGFKSINDIQGHDAGDAVLKTVGRVLRQNLRNEDLAARFGGDEFVIMVRNVRDLNGLLHIMEKLRASLLAPPVDGVDTQRLSASIGFAYTGIHGYAYDNLIRIADSSMYGEKHNHYANLQQQENLS